MLAFILAPANLPFAVALAVMLMIGLVEALGLGLSAAHLDIHADVDGHGADVLGWLGVGQVPLLMVLVVFLASFGIVGLAIQQAVGPLSSWIASIAAAAAALPLTGVGARGLARILPQDETTAVSLQTLVGRRGRIVIGTARRGSPAKACVRDVHGQPHYVMVEPHDEDHPFAEGDMVLLAWRQGDIFIGLGEADGIEPPVHEQLGIS